MIVAHDPGTWFEECLESFATQDYPALSVLVIDAGSAEPVTARVAAVLPDAYVRRLEDNPGVAAATNEVLAIVEGAAFYLLCHDDVALEPSPEATPILTIEIDATKPSSGCARCTISMRDDLAYMGQPIETVVVADGRSYRPERATLEVDVCAE